MIKGAITKRGFIFFLIGATVGPSKVGVNNAFPLKERAPDCSFGNPKRRISEVMSDHSLSSQLCDHSHHDLFSMQL